jgi:hypothetical protein
MKESEDLKTYADVQDGDKTPSVVTIRVRGHEITHAEAADLLQRAANYVKDPQVGHHGYIKRFDRFEGFGVIDEPRPAAWVEIEIV